MRFPYDADLVYSWANHGLLKAKIMVKQTVQAKDLPDDAQIILVDPDEDSEAEAEETENLNNLLADLGELDNIKVTVYRVKEGNKTSWVDSFAPSEIDIEQLMMGLRSDYGGGKFKIQVREAGRIKKSKIVEVEPLPKKREVDTGEIIREFKREQQSESNGMATILAEMIKANQDSQRHQSEQMTTFMTTMVTAMSNMNNQPTAPAVDPIALQTSMLQSVQALREMTQAPPATEPTELILKGVELVNAIKGDGGGDGEANIYSVLSSALKNFGGTLGQAMDFAGSRATISPTPPTPPTLGPMALPGAQPQLAPPGAVPAEGLQGSNAGSKPPTPIASTLEGAHADKLPADHPLAPFEPYVDYMLNLARKNASPELYAEVIIDQIGEEMAYAWLATPEGLQTLGEHIPRTREYMNWFMLVGRAVDELTHEADNPDEPDDDQSDIQVHDVRTGPGETGVSRAAETEVSRADSSSGDTSYLDGDSERSSGDQIDVEAHVETGGSGEGDHTDT